MKEKQLVISKADGTEEVAEILFTYEANGKKYVVFRFLENDEVSAAIYQEDGDDTGTISDIETDEEWDMLDEALASYYDEQEAKTETDDEDDDSDDDVDLDDIVVEKSDT